MYIIQFPFEKYTSEELEFYYNHMVEKFGIPKEQLLMIPDDFSLFKDDIHFLIETRQKINQMIDDYLYEKRCQWDKTKPKPCEVQIPDNEKCTHCPHYYSNDDKKWFDED